MKGEAGAVGGVDERRADPARRESGHDVVELIELPLRGIRVLVC